MENFKVHGNGSGCADILFNLKFNAVTFPLSGIICDSRISDFLYSFLPI